MSSYGTSGSKAAAPAEEDGEILYVPKPRGPTNVLSLALRTAAIVFVFAGMSILAVSMGRSYVQTGSGGRAVAILDEATDATTGRVTYSLLTSEQTLTLFDEFITTFNRDYSKDPDEYNKRLMVFRSNLDICDDRNAKEAAAGGTAIHGVTRFSDLTSEEFVTTYLMDTDGEDEDEDEDEDEKDEDEDEDEDEKDSTPSKKSSAKAKRSKAAQASRKSSSRKSAARSSNKKSSSNGKKEIRNRVRKLTANEPQKSTGRRRLLPSATRAANPFENAERRRLSDPTIKYQDWSTDSTTDIKNSGSCAGSWAIAAAEQIESDAIVDGLLSTTDDLSAQQLLSCTEDQDGCTSGSIKDALEYAQKPGGVFKVSDYAYTSSSGEVAECSVPVKPYAVTVGGIFELNTDDNSANTERLMVQRLSNTGTLSVCLDATIWSTYVSGTILKCDNNQINHCAQVVGVYYSSAEDSGFYKIRNHWGEDWGIDGYVSVGYGGDVCGVASSPLYTDVTQDRRKLSYGRLRSSSKK